MSGHIYGTAGVGVTTGSWVANRGVAQAGAKGEHRTARLLAEYAEATGATVLHDLRIPIPNITANIDHAVVAGRDVWLIDSKMWKPGFMWTLFGHTRRGFEKFPSADKQTMAMAHQAIDRYLRRARIRRPIVAIWSTTDQAPNLALLRIPGASTCHGDQLLRLLPAKPRPAEQQIVNGLVGLLNHAPARGSR